jgi:hypothetical protein
MPFGGVVDRLDSLRRVAPTPELLRFVSKLPVHHIHPRPWTGIPAVLYRWSGPFQRLSGGGELTECQIQLAKS